MGWASSSGCWIKQSQEEAGCKDSIGDCCSARSKKPESTGNANFPDPVTQEPTILSRYEIDVDTKMQGNLDTGNSREVRLVYLDMRFTPKQVRE